jgi:hypothetical protein
MSLFDNSMYRWRETYFVFHQVSERPSAERLKQAVAGLHQHLQVEDLKANDVGQFESMTIVAPDAYAAIDISYVEGEEVAEQLEMLLDELKKSAEDDDERSKVARLKQCDARLDLLHFEQAMEYDDDEEDEFGSAFDPGALIAVMEALTEMCDGVAVDPAAASVM